MGTWEDLQREALRKQAEPIIPVSAERSELDRRMDEIYRLSGLRQEHERKLWGTLEEAYNTWKTRAKTLLDKIDRYAVDLERKHAHANETYKNRSFPLYKRRTGLAARLQGQRYQVGEVRVSDFTFQRSSKDDRFFDVNHRHYNFGDYRDDCDGVIDNRSALWRILCEIFEPKMIVILIRQRLARAIQDIQPLFELETIMKSLDPKDYGFACFYPYGNDHTLEDMFTSLFLNTTVRRNSLERTDVRIERSASGVRLESAEILVRNPFYFDSVKDSLHDGYHLGINLGGGPAEPELRPRQEMR